MIHLNFENFLLRQIKFLTKFCIQKIDLLKKLKKKREISDQNCNISSAFIQGQVFYVIFLCDLYVILLKFRAPTSRPVLLAIGKSPSKLAKFFVSMLEPITVNKYTIKDSFCFAEKLSNYDSNLIMARFDVESSFTNIFPQEAVHLCANILFQGKMV